MSEPSENPYASPQANLAPNEPQVKRLHGAWVGVGLFFVIGIYGNLFVQAFHGVAPKPSILGPSIFWHIVFFVILWKWQGKNAWIGGVLGAIAGMAAFFVAAAISGVMR